MQRLITLNILFFFLVAGLPMLDMHKQGEDSTQLRDIVQQVQVLAGQTESQSQDFVRTFRSAITSLQAIAGIKTIIVKKQTKKSGDANTVVTCVHLPFLPQQAVDLLVDISASELKITKHLFIDTSIIPLLDTPPPIV